MSTGREDLTKSSDLLEQAEASSDTQNAANFIAAANVLALHALTKAVLDVGHANATAAPARNLDRKWEPPLSERKGFGQ